MKTLVIIVFVLFGWQSEVPSAWEKAINKAVSGHFNNEKVQIQFRLADQNMDDRPSPGIVIYDIMHDDSVSGYIVATSARGRYDYFDYLVIYNTELVVEKIRVFEYRSDHGYEICSKKWLRQFENNSGCNIQYGQEIDAISGATISASSITEDLSFLCDYLSKVLK